MPLASAAFASATRAVAVGTAGKTVVSDDGGLNYASIGGDVGGSFSRLRRGPTPLSAFAPGAHGQLALTADGGATWGVASVSTSSDLVDTSWPDLKTGYAIDAKGGLFRSVNSGVSWSTLSPGAGAPARAVLALPGDVVLLVGPRGVKRATGGGEFNAVEGAVVGRTALDDVQLAGSAIFASGRGGKGLLVSATKGESWRAVKLPTKKTRIRSASFSGKRRRATLRKAKGKVTISGKLAGAVGGERVTVSARAITGTDWTSRTVTAGANGGSFSATFTIKHAAVFVGQWAGDSGRAGVGSKPLLVRFR